VKGIVHTIRGVRAVRKANRIFRTNVVKENAMIGLISMTLQTLPDRWNT
jgi:hypothetical protein